MNDSQEGPALEPGFDPFQLMDRFDEEQFRKEMDGIASEHLVYVVREGNQEVVGLSKAGVDEACLVLTKMGQVIREESLEHEILGEGEDREALFKVRAARYAMSNTGAEVKLDQVIGVKRQPIYTRTREGRRVFNPHWYEHGAMKASRNGRFRLIPAHVRAEVIEAAKRTGRVRVAENRPSPVRSVRPAEHGREGEAPQAHRPAPTGAAPAVAPSPYAPTEKQVAFFTRLADSHVWRPDEKERMLEWLATKATRQTIKDQIDWMKRTLEQRKAAEARGGAA